MHGFERRATMDRGKIRLAPRNTSVEWSLQRSYDVHYAHTFSFFDNLFGIFVTRVYVCRHHNIGGGTLGIEDVGLAVR